VAQKTKACRKILIVEDNPDFRKILVTVLRPIASKVVEASDGQQGIEKAKEEVPDVIIMDLGLPGLNGIETTSRIKQDPTTAHIPVVAYTVWGEEFKEIALRAGMAEFLTKVTPPRVLKETVERFLRSAN